MDIEEANEILRNPSGKTYSEIEEAIEKRMKIYNESIKDMTRVAGCLETLQRNDIVANLSQEKRNSLKISIDRLIEMLIAFENVNYNRFEKLK